MRLPTTLASGLFLASHLLTASATVYDQDIRSTHFVTRSSDWEAQLGEYAGDLLDSLDKRQEPAPAPPADAPPAQSAPTANAPPPSATPAGNPAVIDLEAWDAQTRAFCQEQVRGLNGQVENPLGMAVCYNVPFTDNSTGVFMIELVFYNISAAREPWDAVGSNINFTIRYDGARTRPFVQPGSRRTKRETTLTWPPVKLHQMMARSIASPLSLVPRQAVADIPEMSLQRYVGRMDAEVMNDLDNPEMQRLLFPILDFTAINPANNSAINTTLGTDTPSFLNGLYTKETVAAPFRRPFVVPGTKFGVPPVGFVVTMVWAVLFCGAVGFGTFGRLQFREQYRRRVKRSQVQAVVTI